MSENLGKDFNARKVVQSVALAPEKKIQFVLTDEFNAWYADKILPLGFSQNPVDPLNYYDFMVLYADEVEPGENGAIPVKYMHDLHPDRFKLNEHLSWDDTKNGGTVAERTVIIQRRAREMSEANHGSA